MELIPNLPKTIHKKVKFDDIQLMGAIVIEEQEISGIWELHKLGLLSNINNRFFTNVAIYIKAEGF